MSKTFTLDYCIDDGWYVGSLREVPGVISQGKTLDDLKENIRDAYRMMMKSNETTFPAGKFESVDMIIRPD